MAYTQPINGRYTVAAIESVYHLSQGVVRRAAQEALGRSDGWFTQEEVNQILNATKKAVVSPAKNMTLDHGLTTATHVTNEECPSHDIPSPDDIYDGKLVELNQDAWGAEAKITYAGLLKQPPHLRRRLVEEGLTKAYKGLKPKPPASWLSLFDYAAPEHKIALLSMRKPDLAGAYRTVLAMAEAQPPKMDYRITQLLPDDTEQEIHF